MQRTIPSLAFLACTILRPAAVAENPAVCELAVKEACPVVLSGGGTKSVQLLGYRERKTHFWDRSEKRYVEAVTAAEVDVSVDGVRGTVIGGPFRLPQTVNGVAILPSATRGWLGGTVPDSLPHGKSVRIEARDATEPWYEPDRFVYPIPNYRWRAMNYQHTWLGICVHQGALYYHRGEDMGMIPDRGEAVAMTGGVVKFNPAPKGDGRSNGSLFTDPSGLVFRYAHMNTPGIRADLRPGDRLATGERMGLTGETWQGKPQQSDPHLHVDVEDSAGRKRNTYPMFVAAFQNSWPEEPLPVAGGWRHLWAGEEIELDGSVSIPGRGRQIVYYEWTFTDGSRANGPKVRRRYPDPGVYAEQLTIIDDKGFTDSDFVEVYVHRRDASQAPPNGWVNYFPVRDVRPGGHVEFLSHYSRMKDVTLDFGDGEKRPVQKRMYHSYNRPGLYTVTLQGSDDGSGPGVFRLRLVVE